MPLVRVGPCMIPGRSACLECLERRARREFPLYEELAETQRELPPAATVGAGSAIVGSMVAMEGIHLLTGAIEPATLDRALILDLRTMTLTEEHLRRDPECSECGLATSKGTEGSASPLSAQLR